MQLIIPTAAQVAGRHWMALKTAPVSGSTAALHACQTTLTTEAGIQAANGWPVREAAIRAARIALAGSPSDAGLQAALQAAEMYNPETCGAIFFASQQRCIAAVTAVVADIQAVYALAAEEVQQDMTLWLNERAAWYSGFGLTVTPDQEQLLAGLAVLVVQLMDQSTQASYGSNLPDLILGLLTYA